MSLLRNVNPEETLDLFPHNGGGVGVVARSDGAGDTVLADVSWHPAYAARTGLNNFTIPVSKENARDFAPGCPIRFQDSDPSVLSGNGYKYGVIVSHNTATGAIVTRGPAFYSFGPTNLVIEVGSSHKMVQVDLHLPGLWDIGGTTLLNDVAGKAFRWAMGKAYLVALDAKLKVADSGTIPLISVRIGGLSVVNASVTASWSSWIASVTNYEIEFGDTVEIASVVQGSGMDSSDLTLSLMFVLDQENFVYEPASPNPWVHMVTGPYSYWGGAAGAVHALIPTTYTKQTTGSYRTEKWRFTFGPHYLRMTAYGYGTPAPSYGTSRVAFKATAVHQAIYSQNSPFYVGIIQNRLFQTVVQGNTAYTWTRGGSLWLGN